MSVGDKSARGYSVGAVSKQTGLSQHVLRIWERRYNAVTPSRGPSGRRMYSETEIERLMMLSELVRRGHSIGQIAHLPMDQLRRELDTTTQYSAGENDEINILRSKLINTVIDSVKKFDIESCQRALSASLMGVDIETLMYDLFSPILKVVGDEWAAGNLNEAHEHIISSALQGILMPSVVASVSRKGGPALVFATLPEERHHLGLLFVAAIATNYGARCYYLGSDLPEKAIAEAAMQVKAKAICLSFASLASHDHMISRVEKLAALAKCEVWVGGNLPETLNDRLLAENVLSLTRHDLRKKITD